MNIREALRIKKQYAEYDEKFRVCKKRKNFRKANEWKIKRNALSEKLHEVYRWSMSRE